MYCWNVFINMIRFIIKWTLFSLLVIYCYNKVMDLPGMKAFPNNIKNEIINSLTNKTDLDVRPGK